MSDVELNWKREKAEEEINHDDNLGDFPSTLRTSIKTDCQQCGAQMGGGSLTLSSVIM